MKKPGTVLPILTEAGIFLARYTVYGLASLSFPDPKNPHATPVSEKPSPAQQHWHKRTTEAVLRTLAGEPVLSLPPLDLEGHTEFQRSVWKVLLQIAPGKTLSYTEVATRVGRPKGARAAGQACGSNPIPVVIPCHRVLAADRKIGGFSGGIDWKVELLRREGVLL